jgi:hypothetical protein
MCVCVCVRRDTPDLAPPEDVGFNVSRLCKKYGLSPGQAYHKLSEFWSQQRSRKNTDSVYVSIMKQGRAYHQDKGNCLRYECGFLCLSAVRPCVCIVSMRFTSYSALVCCDGYRRGRSTTPEVSSKRPVSSLSPAAVFDPASRSRSMSLPVSVPVTPVSVLRAVHAAVAAADPVYQPADSDDDSFSSFEAPPPAPAADRSTVARADSLSNTPSAQAMIDVMLSKLGQHVFIQSDLEAGCLSMSVMRGTLQVMPSPPDGQPTLYDPNTRNGDALNRDTQLFAQLSGLTYVDGVDANFFKQRNILKPAKNYVYTVPALGGKPAPVTSWATAVAGGAPVRVWWELLSTTFRPGASKLRLSQAGKVVKRKSGASSSSSSSSAAATSGKRARAE